MVRQHHQLNGHEFEQTPGDNEGEGSLVCCSPGGCRVRCDLVTEQQHVRHHHYKQDFCGKCRIYSKLGFWQDCRLLLILTHCSVSRSISSLKLLWSVPPLDPSCFPHVSVGKESACNAAGADSIPGSGGSPGVGSGNPLQYICLEYPMDRGAWKVAGHGVTIRHV